MLTQEALNGNGTPCSHTRPQSIRAERPFRSILLVLAAGLLGLLVWSTLTPEQALAAEKTFVHIAAAQEEPFDQDQANITAKQRRYPGMIDEDDSVWLPIHFAAFKGRVEEMKSLKRKGVDLDTKVPSGRTGGFLGWLPIHFAAFGGQVEAMKWLDEQGVDILNTTIDLNYSFQQWLPIHFAAFGGQVEAMKWLQGKGADVHAKGDFGVTTMMSAARGGQVEAMRWLKAQGVEIPPDIMWFSAISGNLEAMKWLKAQGAGVNATNASSSLPIHMAAINGNLEAMRWLKEQGASVIIKNKNGAAPIHIAAEYGDLTMMKWLMNQGADIQEQGCDSSGEPGRPIHLAAKKGHIEVMKWLKGEGVNINAPEDVLGFTPAHSAAWHQQIAVLAWLKQEGGDFEAKDKRGRTPLEAARQAGGGADVDKTVRWLENNGAIDKGSISIRREGAEKDASGKWQKIMRRRNTK